MAGHDWMPITEAMTYATVPGSNARPTTFEPRPPSTLRIGMLGHGLVGSAVASLARARPDALGRPMAITAALVRDPSSRDRRTAVPLTMDPAVVFGTSPDVLIEVLGGLEPARALVLEAIDRRIPVVTANKSLLAHHGDELLDAAADAGVCLCYEASVIAGVPFLGTFARRPLASSIASFTGVVNGTTNYILSEIEAANVDYRDALAEAQRRGFAEPDPSKDVDGIDAAEKLVVLLRELASTTVAPDALETGGISTVTAADLLHARALGGTLKPIVHAEWDGTTIHAFAGPAFIPEHHPLARLRGATNGIALRDRAGSDLFFSGPGAGPDVTSVTILDDVLEAASGGTTRSSVRRRRTPVPSTTGWLVRLSSTGTLPRAEDILDLLAGYDVWIARTSASDTTRGGNSMWFLTYPCARGRIEMAMASLASAAGCETRMLRALGDRS